MSAGPVAASPFWTFSLAVYGRPGVAAACLALQDRLGAEVNLLLHGCWAASLGQPLGDADIAGALALARPWQRDIVEPLRSARRHLKTGQYELPAAARESLRRRILELELEGERIEQQALADRLPATTAGPGEPPALIAAGNLRRYLAFARLAPGDADRADLLALLRGCFPDAEPAALNAALCG